MSRYDDDRSQRAERAYYDEPRRAPVRVASPPPARRSDRDLPDVYYQRPVEDTQVAFHRDDYRRIEERREVRSPPPVQGDMVLRGKKTETYARPIRRERSPSVERVRVREREREVDRARSQSMDVRERVSYIQREPSVERTRVRMVERERERSPEPVSYRREERRYMERDRERSPSPLYDTERVVRRERTVVRERTPSPVYNDRERVTTRTREIVRQRSPTPPPVTRETTTNIRVTEREREMVRVPSPSPSPEPEPEPVRMVPVEQPIVRAPPIHQEIITHHRHIDHGFEYQPVMVPAPMPTPPPPRVRSPSPPPRLRQEIRETDIDIRTGPGRDAEVDIYHSHREVSRERRRSPSRERRRPEFYDEDTLFERQRESDRLAVRTSNRRSVSTSRNKESWSHSTSDLPRLRGNQSEEDYYARKVEERSRIGEAYNGATKGWEIVDVPPGTERVLMEGAGGGASEITWQKYNGVRRSKFIPEIGRDRDMGRDRGEMHTWDERRESTRGGASYERETETIRERDMQMSRPQPRQIQEDRVEVSNNINISVNERRRERGMTGPPPPMPRRDRSMWTEITKDLIVREAIEELGYDYEETEFFFYIFRYLRYVSTQTFSPNQTCD